MKVPVSQSSSRRTVGSETPSARAGSAAFHVWPWGVREHGPEAAHGRCRRVQPELRQVALEKSSDELAPPGTAVHVGTCGERQREAAAIPQPVGHHLADFRQGKTINLDHLDAAGEGLARLPQQPGGGAAEQEKASRRSCRSASTRRTLKTSGAR